MQSSRTITLFAETPVSTRNSSSFLVSILLHIVAFGLLYLGLKHAPRVTDRSISQRYTVRLLNLHQPEPQLHWAGTGSIHPVPHAVAGAIANGGQPAPPSIPQELVQRIPAPQTLVEPDLPPDLLLPKRVPVPLVVLWTPEKTVVLKAVPPPRPKPATAKVTPTLTPPNREVNLADLKAAASAFVTKTPTLPPSTTSPLVVRGPEPPKVPETTSNSLAHPTPATVMSLSDLLVTKGTIAVPLANETAPQSAPGTPAPGRPQNTPDEGNALAASKQPGTGTGQNPGNQGTGSQGNQVAAAGPAGENGANPGSSQNGPGEGSNTGSGPGSTPSTTRIDLPKNGKFGFVVVGSSLAEEYPDALAVWNGRLAYSVYLQVGLPKSWILQYALPRSAVAAAGSATRPDAPWPYLIVRPHLAPGDTDADAIMVHGFVNTTGHFEQLAIVFPPQFAQTKFVLNALRQWQFRPAVQNGQITTVEVLLIIPSEF